MRARAAHWARGAMKWMAAAGDLVRRDRPGLVVLGYHRVGARTPIEVDLDAGLFADQMAFLAEVCRLESLPAGLAEVTSRGGIYADGRPLVAVTFDDGTADIVDVALPILVEHAVPATVYVATAFVDEGRPFPDDGAPLSWAGLRDAMATGLVTVGSHTHSHALLDRLPTEQVAGELDRSIDLIGEHLGVRAEHFAYPKAVPGSAAAEAEVHARFTSAALGGCHANVPGATDPYRLARSPVQRSDGMRWFERKVHGGMALEDAMRRTLNRRRYATTVT